MREMPAVNIQFDTMGDYLNEQEAAKLDDIGVWMQDHPNSISVVPFRRLSGRCSFRKGTETETCGCDHQSAD